METLKANILNAIKDGKTGWTCMTSIVEGIDESKITERRMAEKMFSNLRSYVDLREQMEQELSSQQHLIDDLKDRLDRGEGGNGFTIFLPDSTRIKSIAERMRAVESSTVTICWMLELSSDEASALFGASIQPDSN